MKFKKVSIFIFFLIIFAVMIFILKDRMKKNSLIQEASLQHVFTEEGLDMLDKEFKDSENIKFALENIGKTPKEFTFKELKGGVLSLGDLKGKKIVLEVLRTNCPTCRISTPSVYNVLKDTDIKLVSVYYNDEINAIEEFMDDIQVESIGPIMYSFREESKQFIEDYRITSIPSLIFIDEEFKISNVHVGGISDEQLREKINSAFYSDRPLYSYKEFK